MGNSEFSKEKVSTQSKHVQDIFILGSLFRGFARLYIFFSGWKLVGEVPDSAKMVAIAGPHTSNWDFPIFVAMALAKHIRFRYLGKDKRFEGPLGWLFRILGGIPVVRGTRQECRPVS